MQELRIRFIIQFQLLIILMTKCKNMPELQKRINTVKEKTKKIREELALLRYLINRRKRIINRKKLTIKKQFIFVGFLI